MNFELGKNDTLNEIRAEIEAIIGEHRTKDYDFCSGLIAARKIIDKYKTKSEVKIEEYKSTIDNPTNGDMIKAIFPNATISRIKSKNEKPKIAVEWNFEPIPSYYNLFYEEWWNAPYKGAEKEQIKGEAEEKEEPEEDTER